MIEHRKAKSEGVKVHLLKNWFSVRRLGCSAIIGSFSWTSTSTKQRWILQSDAHNYGAGWVTPADIARDYLETKFGGKKRRIGTKQYKDFYGNRRNAPIWAEPCELEHAVYIDIKSAYWSITKAVGWDVDYMPNQWLRVLSDCRDFPFPEIKMARNCLVSVAADGVSQMRIWTGSELIFKRGGNALVNKMLWSLVMDVLHGVAHECIAAGAVYCYTDGFIVPHDKARDVALVLQSWGLPFGIKHEGAASIRGAGAYKIGAYKTKKWESSHTRTVHKIHANCDVAWLKKRFSKYAIRRS